MIYETRLMLEPYAISHYGNRIEQDIYMNYYQDYQAYLKGGDLLIPMMIWTIFSSDVHGRHIQYLFLKTYEPINSQIKRMRS